MNWGNKLLVTFVVFGAGMIFLVYRAVKTNYELVEKDYYKNDNTLVVNVNTFNNSCMVYTTV